MSELDLSGFGSIKSVNNFKGFESNKKEVLKNLDEDIKNVEKNGIELKRLVVSDDGDRYKKGEEMSLYELRSYKNVIDGKVRIGIRCRGKNCFLSEEMWRGKLYKIVNDNKSDVIDGLKWMKSYVENNMDDRGNLYYGSKGLKILKSF